MRSERTFLVNQIGELLTSSDYVYFVSYLGLTVKDFTDLRGKLFEAGAKCHVLKNTMIRKAAELNNIDGFDKLELTSGTAMVYGKGDPAAAAKALVEFGKVKEVVAPKGGYFEGVVLSSAQVSEIASLPSREVLYSMLLGVLQGPARNFVCILNNKAATILNVLNAYKEKLEQ